MNILYPIIPGQNGVNPLIRSLDARSEDLNTVIAPGFINSIINMGNQIDVSDLLLIAYKNGTQIFQQTNVDGVISLSIYSPGDNSFPFTNLQFVAKGGSDSSAGNTLGSPKLTIQAAYDAAGPSGLVWVLDSGNYVENLVPPMNSILWAPNATITSNSGVAITASDAGIGYGIGIQVAEILTTGTALAYAINGALTTAFINTQVIVSNNTNSTVAGTLYLNSNDYVHSNINVASSGNLITNVHKTFSSTINITVGGTVAGTFGNKHYSDQTFIDRSISYQDELQETVGRTLALSDGGSDVTIQFNSVTDDNYVLPATATVAIPIGTIVTFVQLGLGRVNFTDDGTSTVINLLGVASSTSGAGAKAYAEKLSATIWIVSGDIEPTTGP